MGTIGWLMGRLVRTLAEPEPRHALDGERDPVDWAEAPSPLRSSCTMELDGANRPYGPCRTDDGVEAAPGVREWTEEEDLLVADHVRDLRRELSLDIPRLARRMGRTVPECRDRIGHLCQVAARIAR
jgi:hypothetical protein